MELPSGLDAPSLTPSFVMTDILDTLLSSEILVEVLSTAPDVLDEGEDLLERAAKEVASAVKRSLNGVRLIKYSDLPEDWKNNPFVEQGYRLVLGNTNPPIFVVSL
jgi:adiponectin receptor